MSAMIMLEVPHVNVLTKMDTVQNKKYVNEYVSCLSVAHLVC